MKLIQGKEYNLLIDNKLFKLMFIDYSRIDGSPLFKIANGVKTFKIENYKHYIRKAKLNFILNNDVSYSEDFYLLDKYTILTLEDMKFQKFNKK